MVLKMTFIQEFELYTFEFLIYEQQGAEAIIFIGMYNSCTIRLPPAGHRPGVSHTPPPPLH